MEVDEKATGEAGLTAPDPEGSTAAPTSAGDEVSGDAKKAALKKEIATEALWHSKGCGFRVRVRVRVKVLGLGLGLGPEVEKLGRI